MASDFGASWRDGTMACRLSPVGGLLMLCMVAGCGQPEEHGHQPGEHGGIIVPVGQDHYHVEALFTEDGKLKFFMLDNDESQVIDVQHQELTVYIRQANDASSKTVVLNPDPQPGDSEGRTSAFSGDLPDDLAPEVLILVVPMIQINEGRYRFSFATTEPLMPSKVTDEAERELYLTPGGVYTEADIAANGSVTASQKYATFRSEHDSQPRAGDKICPITSTKANPSCTWIIGGKEYQFCCPPCVDEFVTRAKEKPDSIKDPAEYVR